MTVGLERRPRATAVAVATAVALGIALRIWVLASPLGATDSDESVSGLMALHALKGEFPAFYWGQAHGGPQEALLAAPVLALFGSSVLAFKLVQVALFAAASYLVWRIGLRTVGPRAAPIAAALSWVWPAFMVARSTKGYAFYGSGLVLSLAVVLVALQVFEEPSRRKVIVLGLLAGQAWWASAQIVYVVAPIVLWLVVRRRAVLKLAAWGIGAFVVGALPWFVYNFQNSFVSLAARSTGVPDNTYLAHLAGFFNPGLPTALGLRQSYSLRWIPGPIVGWAVFAGLVGAFAYVLYRRPRPLEPILVVTALYPFVFALSSFSWYVIDARYFTLFVPFAALLLARGLVARRLELVGLAAAAALTVAGIGAMVDAESGPPSESDPPADLGPLIASLDEYGVEHVFANYWSAYRITFETGERVIAVPTGHVRYQPHADLVARGTPEYLFVTGSEAQQIFDEYVEDNFVMYRSVEAAEFTIYLMDELVLPEDLPKRFPE